MSIDTGTGVPGAPLPTGARRADEKHCHSCGQIVHASAASCPHCGAPQAALPATTQARAPGTLPAGHAYCRGCGKGVHQTAMACPHCGAPQASAAVPAGQPGAAAGGASPWLAGISLAFSLICILSLFDPSEWDDDTLVGYFGLALTGLALGIGSVASGSSGRAMAVTGVVLSSFALIAGVGMLDG